MGGYRRRVVPASAVARLMSVAEGAKSDATAHASLTLVATTAQAVASCEQADPPFAPGAPFLSALLLASLARAGFTHQFSPGLVRFAWNSSLWGLSR